MKQSFLFVLFLFCASAYAQLAQPIQTHRFQVCSVKKATEKLETEPFKTVVEDSSGLAYHNAEAWQEYIYRDSTLTEEQKNTLMANNDWPHYIRLEAASKGEGVLVPTYSNNAVAYAMVQAYADHRPLVLSPDMIWLLILQGFGAHIEANPEKMRHHFVDFQGTQQIRIKRTWMKGDPDNPWENAFAEFSDSVAQHTKNGLASTCLPQFSTTGTIEKAAFNVSLMRAMDPYFDYQMQLSCGIPEITLEGSPEDWALIEKHAAELARYDLDWWIKPLQPVLHEFTRASQGQVDTSFWQNMVKKREYSIICSSQPFLTGWMLLLFPYVKAQPNPWLTKPDAVQLFEQAFAANETAYAQWRKKTAAQRNRTPYESKIIEPEQFGLPTLEVSSFPNSLSKANVLLNDHGTEYDIEFLAGCIGVRQEENTLALRPEFGWRILDKGLHGQTAQKVYAAFVREHVK